MPQAGNPSLILIVSKLTPSFPMSAVYTRVLSLSGRRLNFYFLFFFKSAVSEVRYKVLFQASLWHPLFHVLMMQTFYCGLILWKNNHFSYAPYAAVKTPVTRRSMLPLFF